MYLVGMLKSSCPPHLALRLWQNTSYPSLGGTHALVDIVSYASGSHALVDIVSFIVW